MKNSKKLFAAVAMTGIMAFSVFGMPSVGGLDGFEPTENFMSKSGTVQEIRPFYDHVGEEPEAIEGSYFVLIENDEGSQMTFAVDHLTALIFDGNLEVGTVVTGFYDTNLPVPMIYPPQHHARVLMSPSSYNVIVDRFDADLIAESNPWQLLVNDTPNVEIFLQDGTPFDGELENRLLAVFYELTMSGTPTPLAGQEPVHTGLEKLIIPSRIYVLFERAVHPILQLTPEDLGYMHDYDVLDDIVTIGSATDLNAFWDAMLNPATARIIVNGTTITAPAPFINRSTGTVMLPVAAIADAMGINVASEGAELVDGVSFVPMNFFQEVLPGAAYIMNGNVIIHETPPWVRAR